MYKYIRIHILLTGFCWYTIVSQPNVCHHIPMTHECKQLEIQYVLASTGLTACVPSCMDMKCGLVHILTLLIVGCHCHCVIGCDIMHLLCTCQISQGPQFSYIQLFVSILHRSFSSSSLHNSSTLKKYATRKWKMCYNAIQMYIHVYVLDKSVYFKICTLVASAKNSQKYSTKFFSDSSIIYI